MALWAGACGSFTAAGVVIRLLGVPPTVLFGTEMQFWWCMQRVWARREHGCEGDKKKRRELQARTLCASVVLYINSEPVFVSRLCTSSVLLGQGRHHATLRMPGPSA